jgi:hypothetical protein
MKKLLITLSIFIASANVMGSELTEEQCRQGEIRITAKSDALAEHMLNIEIAAAKGESTEDQFEHYKLSAEELIDDVQVVMRCVSLGHTANLTANVRF